jgi:ribonuclease III
VGRKADVKKLQERIGYRFRDINLLHLALTHGSANFGKPGAPDYDRLEFLGDRVLGLAIAEHLFHAFPAAPEGELARRYNRLVRKEACAEVGEELGLGEYVILGDSEALAGGRRKSTILADVCEALLGAVYVDGGWGPAQELIARHWHKRASDAAAAPVDAKTALQEWVQRSGTCALPRYVLIENRGSDHEPSFVYEVRVEGLLPAVGLGRSRRAAEQAAAAALLVREGVWSASDDASGLA